MNTAKQINECSQLLAAAFRHVYSLTTQEIVHINCLVIICVMNMDFSSFEIGRSKLHDRHSLYTQCSAREETLKCLLLSSNRLVTQANDRT